VNVLVIGNPVAGTGKAGRRAERLVRLLERRGHAVEWRLTRRPGEARRHVGDLEGKVDCIVVAGGDGTVNEVVNGLADPAATPLTHMALGTANLLARELGIPRDPEALVEVVERGATRRIDLARVAQSRFLLVASSGFDAMVTERIQRSGKKPQRYSGYFVPLLRTLAEYRPPRLDVSVEAGEPLTGALVVVSNIRNYGGLFSIADRARCDSGHLDVCVFPRAEVRDLLRYARAARAARVSRLEGVEYRTGRRVRIASAEPVPVQVDGDHWGVTPIDIDLEPSRVPILVPPQPAAAAILIEPAAVTAIP
jgi:YegS/Rv2252/BmrU family lipid kinase